MGPCLGKKKNKPKPSRKSIYTPQIHTEVQKAIDELVQTERNFGLDLKYLMERYLEPLRTEVVFYDSTELMLLYSICADMIAIQKKFQGSLETHTGNDEATGRGMSQDLADIIYNIGEDFITVTAKKEFDIFAKYVVAMSRTQKVIDKKKGGNPQIIQYLEKLQSAQDKKDRIMTMESLLLKPFQRMMLYPLILERLEKHSQDDTCDKEQIIEAIHSIHKVAHNMNEALKRDEKGGEEYKALLKHYEISEYKAT